MRKKEMIPSYIKPTTPLASSREKVVSIKYLPEKDHIYSVQLGKFRHPDWLEIDRFKELGDIILYEDDKKYLIVRMGPYESLENGNEVLNLVKKHRWFETAFLLYED